MGESSSSLPSSTSEKPVIVRVKRKADQTPLEALWIEINERPRKRPLLDFDKLSISASSGKEISMNRRVLVQHIETVSSADASIDFLLLFVQPRSDGYSKFRTSNKERKYSIQKENKHEQLLSKLKQEQQELAKSARFEQIWKRRRENKEAAHDEVCHVYDILRVDAAETSRKVENKEEISVEDQESLSKFLPLLRECIPSAAEEIESDIYFHGLAQESTDGYVYDLYAVKENIDEADASYPFPLVQVNDDDEFYDGAEHSDYETDDSNAENNPLNDYPEEESSDDEEEESERSGTGSESEEVESETESDTWTKSDDSMCLDGEDEKNSYNDDSNHAYSDDGEDWRWAYR